MVYYGCSLPATKLIDLESARGTQAVQARYYRYLFGTIRLTLPRLLPREGDFLAEEIILDMTYFIV